MYYRVIAIVLSFSSVLLGRAEPFKNLEKLAGCYLVDYTYSEVEALAAGYKVDLRVYDVKNLIIKELLKVVSYQENSIRLQHFMQAELASGEVVFRMRHHGETWRFQPQYRYRYDGRFEGNDRWSEELLNHTKVPWVREISSLDDGLRYQCAGGWVRNRRYPTFKCAAFSPIPGRETRDMGRKDYNTMARSTEVTIFPTSFLERQSNTKISFQNGERKPLAKEMGKIWSTRLPAKDCAGVSAWAEDRQPFWAILAGVWQETTGRLADIREIKMVAGTTRSSKIAKLLHDNFRNLAADPEKQSFVRAEMAKIIALHLE